MDQSLSRGDGDPPEWKPPSYAKPIDEEEEWKPPEYAQAAEEEKKPSAFKKIIDALKPAEKIHPGEDIFHKSINAAFQFLDDHPKIREAGQRLLTGTSPEQEERLKSKGIEPKLLGPELATLPHSKEIGEYIRNKGINSGNYYAGVAGSLLGSLIESTPFDARALATQSKEPFSPVREPVRRFSPNDKLTESTPQQDAVAISLTKDDVPRTPANISTETGIPKPSVRRTIGELRKKIPDDATIIKTDEAKYLEDNKPTKFNRQNVENARLEQERQRISQDPNEYAGESIRQPEVQPRDFGYNERDSTGLEPQQREEPPPIRQLRGEVPQQEPVREPVKSIQEPVKTAEEPLIQQPRKFINPFEKPSEVSQEDTRPLPTRSPNLDPNRFDIGTEEPKPPIKNDEDILYDIARKKFNMGQDVPKEGEAWKPPEYAKPSEGEITKESSTEPTTEPSTDKPAESSNEEPDDIVEMSGGLGGIGRGKKKELPISGPYGPALDKLFNTMGKIQENRVSQDNINKIERGRRFAAFAGVKDEGMTGAAKSLSKLKGEFEKVDTTALGLKPEEADSLFTAVKTARITEGEKARGYTALFKILNGDSLPQRNELRILDDVFGNGFADRITQMHGGIGAVGLKLSKLANTMKSLQNSMSLAAPLRHGIGLAYRDEFRPAFADMFKFFANKDYYDSAMQAITDRPSYLLKREAGLFTAKSGSLQGSEEEFLNSYAGDIPVARNVVGASQRGYVGFLNKLRDDVSENMLKTAEGLGVKTKDVVDGQQIPTKETKAIMRFVNVFTGRGELPGGLEKVTNELNMALWSPRMMASRIQMFTNPKIYMDLPKGMRLEGLKSLLGVAALGTVIDTALGYAGAKISYNILSTDFGKSRFGTKLIDPWGGLQQYVVAAARMLAGKTDSSQPTNRLEIAGRFLANKESPAASLAHNLLTAKFTGKSDDPATAGNMTTQYGEKTNIQSQIGKQFVPIFVQDINDLMKSEPGFADHIGLNAIMGVGSLTGMTQEYTEKKTGKLQFRKMKLK